MEKPFVEIDAENFVRSPFDANHIEGYEIPTNKETGERFPNCCPFHKAVFEDAKQWFEKFPNCCDQHKEMASKWWFDKWFNKSDHQGIADKLVRQVSYTDHVISEKINTDDWYKHITDYIDYNVWSFGQPAIGLHVYLHAVKHYITNTTAQIPETKRQSLIEFVEHYFDSPKENNNDKFDLNLLYATYQNWLNAFPFELSSYFGNLKQNYEKRLPILDGKPEVNIYTGIAKAKILTKDKLFEVLVNLTNKLLTQINGVTLYEQGLITDANKIKLELVIAERKNKLKEGYKYNSPDEATQYKKMIQYWFNDEKKFIREITPLLTASTSKQTDPKKDTQPVAIKPAVIFGQVQPLYDILKDFFSAEQQPELKTILETGNNARQKLLFKGNGNRLTDTFRKLVENDFITGCQKQNLINWIISNFTFLHRNQVKAFVFDTVEKIISRNDNPCKRPLIEIKNRKILKV